MISLRKALNLHTGRSGIVLAINLSGIVALAQKWNAILEFVPRVGDFVTTGDPLFRVYGSQNRTYHELPGTVAFGIERTIDQDSTFAFRIIVDIAIKALSSAINDPTTAVLAIDQIPRLLSSWQSTPAQQGNHGWVRKVACDIPYTGLAGFCGAIIC